MEAKKLKVIPKKTFMKLFAENLTLLHAGRPQVLRNEKVSIKAAEEYYWDAVEKTIDTILDGMKVGEKLSIGKYCDIAKEERPAKKYKGAVGEFSKPKTMNLKIYANRSFTREFRKSMAKETE